MTAETSSHPRRWFTVIARLLLVISALLSFLGVPLAALIWFAAGMKTVPRLSGEDMFFALPLPLLAAIFSALAILMERKIKPDGGFVAFGVIATIIPLLIVLLLLGTYISYQ